MSNVTTEPANIDKFAYLKALRGHPLLKGKAGVQLIIRIMADYADGKTLGNARPAINTIASDAGMGRATAKVALHTAVELGFLVVTSPATNRKPAVYALRLPVDSQDLTVQTVKIRPSRGSGSDPNQTTDHNHEQIQSGEAANDAPSSHVGDPELALAPTQSDGPSEGHGEDERATTHKQGGGTSNSWAAASEVEVLTSKDGSKESSVKPTPQQELKLAWGDHLDQIITEAKACAGHYVSDDLNSLLRDAGDDAFADWIAKKGPRIPKRAAQGRDKTIGILCTRMPNLGICRMNRVQGLESSLAMLPSVAGPSPQASMLTHTWGVPPLERLRRSELWV